MRARIRTALAGMLAACLFALPGFAASGRLTVNGVVRSGAGPVSGATVTLYQAGTARGAAPVTIGSGVTDRTGRFLIPAGVPRPGAVYYVVAEGGQWLSTSAGEAPGGPNAAIRLTAVIGTPDGAIFQPVVNERTTVAFAYALAQFASGAAIAGPAPGLANAAETAGNLANAATGAAAGVLAAPPNGSASTTLAEFNSLANLLATCVEAANPAPCAQLFAFATVPGHDAPADTLAAIQTIATHPANNAVALFGISSLVQAYTPALARDQGPDAWTIAVAYVGNGTEMDAPGNIAVDRHGNLWITNNYEYNDNPHIPVCGGKELLKLTPTGQDAPGAPFSGSGIDGAGFGVALDRAGTVWVGNFGFAGAGCMQKPPSNTVSWFSPSGQPLSENGFSQGGIMGPQGMAFDQSGNLWITNDKPDANNEYSVTVYPGGDPTAAIRLTDPTLLNQPFGIAIDGDGDAWVTNRGNGTVVEFNASFQLVRSFGVRGTPSYRRFLRPLAIAIDSKGNAWVADQGLYSVVMITPLGQVTNFTGGGLAGPWGIAVDGADHVFVSNFGGKEFLGATVTELCGAEAGCGDGLQRGDPMSPATGFTSNAFTRLTGTTIDASGNVWVPANWNTNQLKTNPGGHAVLELVGLAAPVRTPMFGPPRQP